MKHDSVINQFSRIKSSLWLVLILPLLNISELYGADCLLSQCSNIQIIEELGIRFRNPIVTKVNLDDGFIDRNSNVQECIDKSKFEDFEVTKYGSLKSFYFRHGEFRYYFECDLTKCKSKRAINTIEGADSSCLTFDRSEKTHLEE